MNLLSHTEEKLCDEAQGIQAEINSQTKLLQIEKICTEPNISTVTHDGINHQTPDPAHLELPLKRQNPIPNAYRNPFRNSQSQEALAAIPRLFIKSCTPSIVAFCNRPPSSMSYYICKGAGYEPRLVGVKRLLFSPWPDGDELGARWTRSVAMHRGA